MEKLAQILLVEDNKMDVALTRDAFREARLANKIHVVSNGETALKYLFGEGEFSDRNQKDSHHHSNILQRRGGSCHEL